jgi:hypothetical protein
MRKLKLIGVLISACAVIATAGEQLPNLSEQNPASRFTVTDLVWDPNPGDASISLWGDDKLAAMSFTIDDNCYGNVDWWMQTSETYGFKLTWFLITDRITLGITPSFNGTWPQWAAVQAAGHDIGSHTIWHLHTELPEWTNIDDEYRLSQIQIETNISGYTCETLAYPGGDNSYLNNRTNAQAYYAAARGGVGSGFNKPNTIDYMAVKHGLADRRLHQRRRLLQSEQSLQCRCPELLPRLGDLPQPSGQRLQHDDSFSELHRRQPRPALVLHLHRRNQVWTGA